MNVQTDFFVDSVNEMYYISIGLKRTETRGSYP